MKFRLVEDAEFHPVKINEDSIDPEGKYTDYGTGKVDSDNIFDSKTHTPYYDQFLSNPEYMEKEENLKGYVKMMSPREYYEECASKIFGSSVQSLINGRKANTHSTNEIKELITKYKRQVFLPYINYAEGQQEGLHRMLVAAELFGWDHKFPVLVVEWADEEKAKKIQKQKQDEITMRSIRRVVNKALEFSYKDMGEFEDQIEYFIDEEFEDEDSIQWKVYQPTPEVTCVRVNGVVFSFDTEYINMKEPDEIEPDDLDDLDWEDLEFSDDELAMLKDAGLDDLIKKYGG